MDTKISSTVLLALVILVGLTLINLPCGLSVPHGRIVGGTDASPGEIPYQVNVQAYDFDLNKWVSICGGTILNPYTILSAAHCMLYGFTAAQDSLFRIIAGEHNTEVHEGTEQYRDVESIYAHYEFDYFTYRNDVAVFILTKPLEFNSVVKSIKLPPSDHLSTGYGVVTGWGLDEENAQATGRSILQKIRIPLIEAQKCKDQYGDAFISDSMMCAGGGQNDGDACAGDSGGPLVANDLNETYVAGIVSWGVGCGRIGYPGIYTKVSRFTHWIEYVLSQTGQKE